ncbi:helix-turn-helix domain-containing protein [Denitromonas sp. IR12]|uniref:Helix-turn-helix domain-containing protein n=2 Tax=Denitromonas iodatirespirans TaxID=2795389 RepID=A0A944D9Y0_DENI1|nr:helix-turn-helix domain-containing protein [Denitromonas iodatirespirans]
MLRTTREGLGLTLVDVAQALKLTQRQVEALESERFDTLPGAAFARGFLRNYARLLGLDPEPLIQALSQTSGVGAPAELAPISNAQGTLPNGDGSLRPSSLPIALIALVILLGVVAGWYFDWFQGSETPAGETATVDMPVAPAALTPVIPPADNAPLVIPDDAPSGSATESTDTPAVRGDTMPAPLGTVTNPPAMAVVPPANTNVPPAPAITAPAAEAPKPAASTPAAPAQDHRLVFRFEKESWVEVRDASGEIIFSRTNRPGSVQEVSGKPPYQLVVGNAKSVAVEYGGKPVDLAPHTKVSVARLTLE